MAIDIKQFYLDDITLTQMEIEMSKPDPKPKDEVNPEKKTPRPDSTEPSVEQPGPRNTRK